MTSGEVLQEVPQNIQQPEPEPSEAAAAADFIESAAFAGPKPGYVYANRDGQVGYHADRGVATAAAACGGSGLSGLSGVTVVSATIEAEAEFLDFQVPEGTAVGSTIIIEVRPHPPLPTPLPASVPMPAGSS